MANEAFKDFLAAIPAVSGALAGTELFPGLSGGVTKGMTTNQIAKLARQLALTGIISPTSLSADQNNWNPTGLATCSTIRIAAGADHTISGIVAPAVDGTLLILENVSNFVITLLSNNAGSTAANRFSLTNNIALRALSGMCLLRYDLTNATWRAVGANVLIGTDVEAWSAKLDALAAAITAGQIPVGNAGGTAPAYVSMSGDATLASTGALTIAANAITSGKIIDAAVTLAKQANLAANSIQGNNTGSPGVPLALTASQVRTLLSLVIGTNVQAWAAILDTLTTNLGTLEARNHVKIMTYFGGPDGYQPNMNSFTGNGGGIQDSNSSKFPQIPFGANKMQMQTSADGYAGYTSGKFATCFGNGAGYLDVIIRSDDTLSNATDTYEIIAGFFNTNDGSTAITDGFYALYTHGTNGGKWQANCVANGSAGTPLDIGVTFAVDTTYRLHFTFNAAGTSVSVAIATNGGALSAAQTFVANIPVGAFRNFGYGMRIRRTAGNSNNRVAYAGMCDFDMVPTNPL